MRRILSLEHLESRAMLDGAAASIVAPLGEGEGTPQPDFDLTDVNPASERFEQSVSPRDYLDQVSAWYFGHAT